MKFFVDTEVWEMGVRAFAVEGRLLRIRKIDPQLEKLKSETAEKLIAAWRDKQIAQNEIVAGFHQLHNIVGKGTQQFMTPVEYLINYALEKGRFLTINTCVDAYNLVSATSLLALGAHDSDKIWGDVRLVLTEGTETFVPLGGNFTMTVDKGEYAYMDDDSVLCRMDIRQAEKAKVTLETQNVFFIIQGNPLTDEDRLRDATQALIGQVDRFCGGTFKVVEPSIIDRASRK